MKSGVRALSIFWLLGAMLMSSVLSMSISAAEPAGVLDVQKSVFGKLADGTEVHRYTLTNANGLEAQVMTYGATWIAMKTPDKNGALENITLFLDTFDDYAKGHPLLGSVVGRFANRIKDARFFLEGTEYKVTPNAAPNHIHGGREAVQKKVWKAMADTQDDRARVMLTYTDPDGHEGYPGTVQYTVTYELTNANELIIRYQATTDKPTVINLTNHAYFNLSGAGSGTVLDQVLSIPADYYLPTDENTVPTGEIASVEGTPLDYRQPHSIGERIEQVEGKNYDHCYVIQRREAGELALAAVASDSKSGRRMEVHTTQPGVQLYTAIHLNPRLQGGGKNYGPYHGFCLETQHFPAGPNYAHFPSTTLRPGEVFEEITVHKFSVEK